MFKLHRNSNNTGFRITITVRAYTLSVGIWRFGWENPASYYKRFDRVRFQFVVWQRGTKEGDFFYSSRGFDKEITIRDDGQYRQPIRSFLRLKDALTKWIDSEYENSGWANSDSWKDKK